MANIFTDILDDKVFKVVFGNKLGRNNMINFLRALLPELGITEIEYLNCEQMGLSPEEGKSVFDLSVLTGDGSGVIVEMPGLLVMPGLTRHLIKPGIAGRSPQ